MAERRNVLDILKSDGDDQRRADLKRRHVGDWRAPVDDSLSELVAKAGPGPQIAEGAHITADDYRRHTEHSHAAEGAKTFARMKKSAPPSIDLLKSSAADVTYVKMGSVTMRCVDYGTPEPVRARPDLARAQAQPEMVPVVNDTPKPVRVGSGQLVDPLFMRAWRKG